MLLLKGPIQIQLSAFMPGAANVSENASVTPDYKHRRFAKFQARRPNFQRWKIWLYIHIFVQ